MEQSGQVPAVAMGVQEWRARSKALGQVLRFTMDRMHLEARGPNLTRHLRYLPHADPAIPIHWLRLECVGEPGAGTDFDPAVALRVALSSCHRPEQARVYFLVRGEPAGCSVHLGVRGLGAAGDSESLARAVRGFAESAWPATRFAEVADPEQLGHRLRATLDAPGRRFALTGVPVPQSAGGRAGCGLETLIDGLVGKSYTLLIIADPAGVAAHEEMLGRARDLLGAVHALQRMHVTSTASSAVSTGFSTALTESRSEAHQAGVSTAGQRHSQLHKLVDLVTAGSVALAPLIPAAGMVAGLAAIAGDLLPLDLTSTDSESTTRTTGTSRTITESTGTTDTQAVAVAREYVSVHLQVVCAGLERWIARMEGGQVWDVGVYVVSSEPDDAQDAASQLVSLLNGPRRPGEEPIRVVDLQPYWRHGVADDLAAGRRPQFELVNPLRAERQHHPLGRRCEGLSTPLSTDELARLCALPRREVPGIRVRPFASFGVNPVPTSGPSVRIGGVLRGDQPTGEAVHVGLASLTKNVLVTGSVGSGKTSTVRHMLGQLQGHGVPFLVIEPAKTEYLEWAQRHNEGLPTDSPDRIAVYAPGVELDGAGVQPLELNPFYAHSPGLVTTHIERLKALLVGSLPMQEAMPMLLESVLYALYRHKGWFGAREMEHEPRWPTVTGALVTKAPAGAAGTTARPDYPHASTLLASVVLEKGYDERVAQSFIGALRTRLGFLAEPGSWKSRVFDCAKSTPAAQLFGRPAVVNLSALHADRTFVAGLLLAYLHEYRQTDRAAEGLRHIAVLEEAHCLLEPSRHVGAEAMDPKGTLSAMCAELLSEMRAWGQGFVLVDQYPTRLIADAVKNTNLKIVHRLPARDDQDAMAAAMSLSEPQRRIIPFLRPGQAIVIGDQDDAPIRVQVPSAMEGRS